MKRLLIAMTAFLTITLSASAMSYEQARQQALFLTDKMAYELNLTEEQYEAAYEVNLDYLMSVNTQADLYGTYWTQRNLDLSYILLDWQYNAFVAATYFYRPLYWSAGYWHFGIYARYPYRDYFYFGRPHFWTVYRGGHSWRHNGGRSYYHGRNFVPRGHSGHGMRDGFDRGDYGRGGHHGGNHNGNHGGGFGRNNNGNGGNHGNGGNVGGGGTPNNGGSVGTPGNGNRSNGGGGFGNGGGSRGNGGGINRGGGVNRSYGNEPTRNRVNGSSSTMRPESRVQGAPQSGSTPRRTFGTDRGSSTRQTPGANSYGNRSSQPSSRPSTSGSSRGSSHSGSSYGGGSHGGGSFSGGGSRGGGSHGGGSFSGGGSRGGGSHGGGGGRGGFGGRR